MKVHILYEFRQGPWGGGNQFLSALREFLQSNNRYAETPQTADALVINSYHNLLHAIKLRSIYPKKLFVHRLGPLFHKHRGDKWKQIDSLIIQIANQVMDLIIFQSQWSLDHAVKLGFNTSKPHLVIGNAAIGQDFYKSPKTEQLSAPIKLVANSWSANWSKGFEFYRYLDQNLDYSKYNMTFIGNSPIEFQSITMLKALSRAELGNELRQNDIFIFASQDDACSNSVIEALACGLPTVALDSGGNAEIVGAGGEMFHNNNQLLVKIEQVTKNYSQYRKAIVVADIQKVGTMYLNAMEQSMRNDQISVAQRVRLCLIYLQSAATLMKFKLERFSQ